MDKSRVIILKSTEFKGTPPESGVGHFMELLRAGFDKLREDTDCGAVLNSLFPGGKSIGIKPNCVAGRAMSSSPALCRALINLLAENGIEKGNIVVWERSERELERAGYPVNREGGGPKIIANDTPGVGYHNDFSVFGTVGSLVTRILTDRVDYHINFPILKDHSIAGLSGGLKNFYGAVHNPNKYHDPNCNPYAADMYCLPAIKDKNKLTIMDCFRIQYNGGPSFRSKYALDSNIILMSEDPVALDTVALELLEKKRKLNGLESLKTVGRYPEYLFTAADDEHKLGAHDNAFIDKLEIIV